MRRNQLKEILNGLNSVEDRDGFAMGLRQYLIDQGVNFVSASNVATAWHQAVFEKDITELMCLIRVDERVNQLFTEYAMRVQ